MKVGSTMYTTLQLLAIGICLALASSSATAQASRTGETSVRHEQKPAPAHAVLAVVARNSAPIYADSSGSGRAIGFCPKGLFLTVMGQTPHDYCVLAAHNRRVYVVKADVKLLGSRLTLKHSH